MRHLPTLFLSLFVMESAMADTYLIDPAHTMPIFQVKHLGFSTQVGRFDKTSGKIQLDVEKKTGTVEWSIDADSIDMGLEKWNEHMKSADFFNVAKFPTITYRADKLTFKGKTPISATGTLTLLGVSRPIQVSINGFNCGTNPINQKALCAADIEATLKRSEFGMTYFLPGVGDEVRVYVPVEAYKE